MIYVLQYPVLQLLLEKSKERARKALLFSNKQNLPPMSHSSKINTSCIAALSIVLCANLYANPSGEVVVGGSATFSSAGNVLNVNQTSNRATSIYLMLPLRY